MAINFLAITSEENVDQFPHSQSILGFPRKRPDIGLLNNRSKFNALQIVEPSPVSALWVDPQANTPAALWLTKAFATPGVTFKAEWNTSTSYCLTYFQWGNSLWARVAP